MGLENCKSPRNNSQGLCFIKSDPKPPGWCWITHDSHRKLVAQARFFIKSVVWQAQCLSWAWIYRIIYCPVQTAKHCVHTQTHRHTDNTLPRTDGKASRTHTHTHTHTHTQDNTVPCTDGKASRTHTHTHTHMPVKQKVFFTPSYTSLYRNLHWFFSLSTQGFTLISTLLGKRKRWLEIDSGRRAGKAPTPAALNVCYYRLHFLYLFSRAPC